MKTIYPQTFFSGLVALLLIVQGLNAQEVKITQGATIKVNGAANIIMLNADIENNGNFTATQGSTVKIKGTDLQTIGGDSSMIFENLHLDNLNGLMINNSETVNGILTFTNGKITLNDNDLILGSSATISGSSTLSYVVTNGTGSLRQRVTNNATDVAYPVGLESAYLPATVQLTVGSTADELSVRVINGLYTAYDESNVPTGSLINDHSVSKTWVIEEAGAGGSNATVKLQWNADNETAGFDRDKSDISNFTSGQWNYSYPAMAAGTGPYTQTIAGITAFSPLGIFSPSILCTLNQTAFCAGDAALVSYIAKGGLWNAENTFTAQLSDTNGSFETPVIIGSLAAQGSGEVIAVIPLYASDGSLYRIRISSDNPVVTGNDNGQDLSIAQLRSINGDITYYNQANTPLTSDITVKLFQAGSQVGADYAVTNGTFAFNDLCPGEYELRITSTKSTAGSVNTTDAAQVHFWGANPYTIEKVRFYAGDVAGGSFFLNSTDAQLLKAHFVYGTAFEKGEPWTFWNAGQTISSNSNPTESYPVISLIMGSNATAEIYGLCTGDFNRSFSASQKSTAALSLTYAGALQVNADTEFEMPLKIVNSSAIGAISICMNIPSDLLEIKDIVMSATGTSLDWSVTDNELRIGWFSQNPVYLNAQDELLTLKLKTTVDFLPGKQVLLTLKNSPVNELADEKYNVVPEAVLSTLTIEASAFSVNELPAGEPVRFVCYPNPFTDKVWFRYVLDEQSDISIEIRSMLGNVMDVITIKDLPAGIHKQIYNSKGLVPGIYIATLNQITKTNYSLKTIKIIKEKTK